MAAKFEPKEPVQLNPPNHSPISTEELAKSNGVDGRPCYVGIKGIIFDVSGKDMYLPGGSYSAFAGKDASRALGLMSTKAEDVRPDWYDLADKEKQTLNDWFTFFSKRYNIVGTVEGATNTEPSSSS
ncbi:probable DAP1 Damage response protein [Cephalotrichum gorgonifer]|uniref:Probable DAP1 Damage response protein n=1 Tax=Cephalotrichum gorgonifer TaxID=2041049 RepID=A0AAE8MPX8_9PEZI|nr:probable DAP1 Damage response protein [Cephalotrichum gorgonifer]